MIYQVEYRFGIKQKIFKCLCYDNKNELKTLAKHISCDCKRKFDGSKCT